MRTVICRLGLVSVSMLGTCAAAWSADFARDIEPILEASCIKCHGPQQAMAGLRLDSEAAVLKGGSHGSAIVPGKSSDSLLVQRILGSGGAARMPMGGKPLPDAQIATIRAWIDQLKPDQVERDGSKPSEGQTTAKASPVFAEKIRPVLASRCYSCHGPQKQQNGLRVDSLEALLKGSANGKVVVPGKANGSVLVRRLAGQDLPRMPYGGPPLSAEEIATIRQWVDAGAPGPDSKAPISRSAIRPQKHWAYMKPERPELPTVKDAAWCRNPIDRFVLARLEKENLQPSPEADRYTLIRRVYLDLIGLPPTPEEVDAFVADKSPDAYEKVVDRLLASPQYGVRWARPWLDAARYADTDGYEKDLSRVMWEYRDWVVNALNRNMPFSQFTIEQIAGDLLPQPTNAQLVATGFNRNTMKNREGGVDPEEYYFYELEDRANTTAEVWLGSTIGCAQCHNHKFDPFTQKDYYRFLAFFSNAVYTPSTKFPTEEEPELQLPNEDQARQANEIRERMKQVRAQLNATTPELEAAQAKWEAALKAAPGKWSIVKPVKLESSGGATLTLQPDGSVLAGGKNPYADTYTIQAATKLTAITGLRIEVLNDPSLPHGGPGRDPDGNFFLSDVEVRAAPVGHPEKAEKIEFKSSLGNDSQRGYDAKSIVDKKGKGVQGWAIDTEMPTTGLPRQAVLMTRRPFGFAAGTTLTIVLKHEMRHASRNLGRFRVSLGSMRDPLQIVSIPADMWRVLEAAPGERTPEQRDKLAKEYRAIAPMLDPARKQMAKLNDELKDLHIPTAMIMRERPGNDVPATWIRDRGSFLSKTDRVTAGVPGVLNRLPQGAPVNRLGLAEWLVSDENPLTARVTVNRDWETIFGHGIVETVEDFGTQGDPPSNQELLDWLATEFMRTGWDMKALRRLIVTSATYRQSSRVTPELEARDPYNKLLARGPRFRVEAEMVHDIALDAGGLLSLKIGGPSVFPYQPEGIWDVPYSTEKWVMSEGEDRYRRSLYTFLRRSAPYPSLLTFDAPDRQLCTLRRIRTNTPLQALTLLNDPFFVEAARGLARRVMQKGGAGVDAKASYAFRLCVARPPSKPELQKIVEFYDREKTRFERDRVDAAELASVSRSKGNAAEEAAWTMVSNVLLNMDETITKD